MATAALVRTILLLLFLRLYLVVVVVSCSFPNTASAALGHLEQLGRVLGSETVFTQVALDFACLLVIDGWLLDVGVVPVVGCWMLVLFLWLVVYVFTQVALDVGVPAAWFTRMPRCSILLMVVVSHLDFYFRCNCPIVQILACLRVWKSRGSSAVFLDASCLAFPPCS